jgi:hypothetical protein
MLIMSLFSVHVTLILCKLNGILNFGPHIHTFSASVLVKIIFFLITVNHTVHYKYVNQIDIPYSVGHQGGCDDAQ